MYTKIDLRPPIFEIGLKAYMYGEKALELAIAADKISKKYGVKIIFDPQYVDIPKIVEATDNLLIFAQHMDSVTPGRGQGSVLPEALKEAGVVGTILNHVERRLTLSEISKTIKRADEVGLATMVCVDSPQEAAAIAYLNPNIIVVEPPELIGGEKSVGKVKKEFIAQSKEMIKKINPEIIVFCGGGVRSGDDVAEIIRLGADATGSSSGILTATNPIEKMEEMVKATKMAWEERHHEK